MLSFLKRAPKSFMVIYKFNSFCSLVPYYIFELEIYQVVFFFVFSEVFLFFFNFIFKLYIIVLVLPIIKMNPPQVHMCSPFWTLPPPPSPHHPSGPSQCTSPKHPASHIEPGPAACLLHDIRHVSMSFSQIFPPSPSPTESIRLFYTSVSLLLSRTQGYCYHLSKFHIPSSFYIFTSIPWSPLGKMWSGMSTSNEKHSQSLNTYISQCSAGIAHICVQIHE